MLKRNIHFSRNEIQNFENNNIYVEKIPLAFFMQKRYGTSLWDFLETNFPLLPEHISFLLHQEMWLIHDSAVTHFSVFSREYLN